MDGTSHKIQRQGENPSVEWLRCSSVGEWLKKYSPVLFEFNQLSLTFTKEGKPITLKGVSETPKFNMMTNNGSQKALLKKVGKLVCLLFSVNTKLDIQLHIPNPILPLLNEFEEVFKEPQELPPTKE